MSKTLRGKVKGAIGKLINDIFDVGFDILNQTQADEFSKHYLRKVLNVDDMPKGLESTTSTQGHSRCSCLL